MCFVGSIRLILAKILYSPNPIGNLFRYKFHFSETNNKLVLKTKMSARYGLGQMSNSREFSRMQDKLDNLYVNYNVS